MQAIALLDYNGGNNGTISDESFNNLIATVESYLSKEKRVKMLRLLSASLKAVLLRNIWIHLQFRGSSLDRDDNGLLTLAGGKITDYRKMAEGAMERVVEILKAEFDRSFKLINSKTYPVSGGELNQQMWTQKSKPLRNLECHVAWIARKPTISQIFTVQMHRRSLPCS